MSGMWYNGGGGGKKVVVEAYSVVLGDGREVVGEIGLAVGARRRGIK